MTVALQEQVSITDVDIYYLNEDEIDEPGWYVDMEYSYGKSDSFGPYLSRNAAKRAAWGAKN